VDGDIGERSKGKTREGANNPVTLGDTLSHRAMTAAVMAAFPGINVISEEDEEDDGRGNAANVRPPPARHAELDAFVKDDLLVPFDDIDIWIDPLDATQEYTEGLTEYVTTMACVAVGGVPVAAAIHKPFGNASTAWGWAPEGKPGLLDPRTEAGLKVAGVRNDRSVEGARLIVSRSHAGDVREAAAAAFGEKAAVEPAGGAGYKTLEVMRGAADAYVHVTFIKKWDLCAGEALLRAAGGRLTALNGQELNYSRQHPAANEGGVLAAVHDHEEYAKALRDAGVRPSNKKKAKAKPLR